MRLNGVLLSLLIIMGMLLAGCTEAIPMEEGEAEASCQFVAKGDYKVLNADYRERGKVTVLSAESTDSSLYSDEPHCLLVKTDATNRFVGDESFESYQVVDENGTAFVDRVMISGTEENPVIYYLTRDQTGEFIRGSLDGELLDNGTISWGNEDALMLWVPCDGCVENSLRGTFILNQNTYVESDGTVTYNDVDGDGIADGDELYGCFNSKALNHDVNVTEHFEEACEFPSTAVEYYTQIATLMFELDVYKDVSRADDFLSHLQAGDTYYWLGESLQNPDEDISFNKSDLRISLTNTSVEPISRPTLENPTVELFLTDYNMSCVSADPSAFDEEVRNLSVSLGAYSYPFGEHEWICYPKLYEQNREIVCVTDVWNGEEYYTDVEIREFNDGYERCLDGSDEYNASDPQEFPCLDGTNISLELANDGALDCPDGSDEPVNEGSWIWGDIFIFLISDRYGSWEIVAMAGD